MTGFAPLLHTNIPAMETPTTFYALKTDEKNVEIACFKATTTRRFFESRKGEHGKNKRT